MARCLDARDPLCLLPRPRPQRRAQCVVRSASAQWVPGMSLTPRRHLSRAGLAPCWRAPRQRQRERKSARGGMHNRGNGATWVVRLVEVFQLSASIFDRVCIIVVSHVRTCVRLRQSTGRTLFRDFISVRIVSLAASLATAASVARAADAAVLPTRPSPGKQPLGATEQGATSGLSL